MQEAQFMNIKIEKKNLSQLNLTEWKGKCSEALDCLWESHWLRSSITKNDRKLADVCRELADEITRQSDVALFLCSGAEADLIKAFGSALETREGGAEVLVFGDTFSTAEYEKLLNYLETRDFSLIAVTKGEESLSLRAAYACLKKILISRYGMDRAAERLYAICGKESIQIAKDAAENDYPLINYPAEDTAECGGNTLLALLPLAVKGWDVSEYLDGFYEMLASPIWDLDGCDYAAAKAAAAKKGICAQLLIWQSRIEAFGRWSTGGSFDVRRMPADERWLADTFFESHILIEEDDADLMMPYFEGCSTEGSLNSLLGETCEKYFHRENGENPGVKLSMKSLDSYNLGQLTAYVQLSEQISEYLLKN